ncbi:hypothetical protein Tco_1224597, partial [Tanacetum coccineum]
MLLGYKVNTKGIKVCPDKVDAVLSLPSPKCLKDVQKLNGKLTSLNRFLAKSAEKSLPFFKTLKKCTKKSDFCWTDEAESEFKKMKQHIAELPMLTAPEEKEELIVYLAAARETVLVAQDGLGGYDWSNDFEVEPVNYALMAISSSRLSSSSDSENELAWGERYEFQNYDLKCREIKINNLNLELEKVVKERDELKLKIEKWEGSSKNLTKEKLTDKGKRYRGRARSMAKNIDTGLDD